MDFFTSVLFVTSISLVSCLFCKKYLPIFKLFSLIDQEKRVNRFISSVWRLSVYFSIFSWDNPHDNYWISTNFGKILPACPYFYLHNSIVFKIDLKIGGERKNCKWVKIVQKSQNPMWSIRFKGNFKHSLSLVFMFKNFNIFRRQGPNSGWQFW